MKLLIVGSRSIEWFDISSYIPDSVDLIISGGASGVDSIAEKYADDNRISKMIIRPRYDMYGKAAPLKRNEYMVDMSDEVLVVWDGKSRGTMYTVKYAEKKNKPINIITIAQE